MMQIPVFTILCVGTLKDPHIEALVSGYLKRLGHEARVDIKTVGDSTPHDEGERIAKILEKTAGRSFALSEEGQSLSSRGLASLIESTGTRLIFIIGGPDGLSDRLKKKTNGILSLSPLTFTHEFARLLLVEQLYRACTILHNRSYHRG